MDNREYAVLKAFGTLQGTEGVPGLDLGGIDFESLARTYGLPCRQASRADDLATALRGAFAEDGPSVVWVPIDSSVPPLL